MNKVIQPSTLLDSFSAGTLRDCRFNKLTGANARLAANNDAKFKVYTMTLTTPIVDRPVGITPNVKYFRMAYHPSNTSLIYI